MKKMNNQEPNVDLNGDESINLKVNSKGQYYWDINIKEVPELTAKSILRIGAIDKSLREQFPNNVFKKEQEQTVEELKKINTTWRS